MAGALAFGFAMLVVALIAECVVSKGSFSGIRRIVVLLILISSAVFATAQFRYASVDENRDSYMQYMTDEKSVIVWGKIYKTEYKYFSYRYYMTDCVVQPGTARLLAEKYPVVMSWYTVTAKRTSWRLYESLRQDRLV